MAKVNARKKKIGGPLLATAVFCESVIEDKNGSMSLIRIIDNITIQIDPNAPEDFPSESNRLPVPISALISFKTGDSPGYHKLRIDIESPSGNSGTAFEANLNCSEPPQGGANVTLRTIIHVMKGGLFWFHLFLDGKKIGQMPLVINVKRSEEQVAQLAPAARKPVKKPAKRKE